ncbi:TPA: fimbria/pilus periplasmic chaperone [Klebsiella pneumoniae]|uniref:FotE n=1 Tax=Escherichia coli TaxID=562 RepID=Q846A8_ECOLX|nr:MULTISPECIES: fimbria/pilus periplasmic chaperone [Enterobacteriaceae]HBR4262132.1 fimbria/pilus periplasmic chaperone [Klebsiella pneumoniae]AAO73850.1 FotE [Escherichia coli]EJG3799240.1 fimbria/pilus periplasmic chaperone [Escherichia coli]MCX0042944.1 fimbria/pilus periplasmic chaperone [Escherichia coli]WAL55447.1 fimbria/pilus periplasmic chaperone [Klebsiella variicola subsp. tropica]
MKGLLILLLVIVTFNTQGVLANVDYPYPEDTILNLNHDTKDLYLKGSIRISNPGSLVWLVQTWTEDENKSRFADVYPALMRLEPYSSKVLKVYQKSTPDRKELKWLLISFIPSQDKIGHNQLTIPVFYRLKIIEKH